MTGIITLKSVEVDLDDVLEQIDAKDLIAEIDERASTGCPDILSALEEWAEEYGDDDAEGDPEPAFQRMSDWDLDDLRKAVREDDGRRAVDLLKRALV